MRWIPPKPKFVPPKSWVDEPLPKPKPVEVDGIDSGVAQIVVKGPEGATGNQGLSLKEVIEHRSNTPIVGGSSPSPSINPISEITIDNPPKPEPEPKPVVKKASRRTRDVEDWPELKGLSFMDFVSEFAIHMSPPTHFKPLLDRIGDGKGFRGCIGAPIQHGKSTTIKLWIVWMLVNNPTLRIAYFGYGQKFAEDNTYDLREMIPKAGIRVQHGADTKDSMRFESGGSLVISSVVLGRGTGLPIDVAIIDDPFKGPADAYSKIERDKVYEWYLYVVHGRVPKQGTIIIIASRWDEDDLSGRLIKRQGYEELLLPAINDNGEALCPWGPDPLRPRTLESLLEIRDGKNGIGGIGEHAWNALYQGKPTPRDTTIFRGVPATYTELPKTLRVAIGVDLGFTEKTDHSAAVVLGVDTSGQTYVIEAIRWRRRLEVVATGLRVLANKYPTAQLFTYYSGAEIQSIRTLQEQPFDLDVVGVPARYHKAFRAERAAAAWSKGGIAIPAVASWDLVWFLSELRNFTGAEGDEDDGVDAMVAAFDALDDQSGELQPGFHGRRCM